MRRNMSRLVSINGVLAALCATLALSPGGIAHAMDGIQGCCRLDINRNGFCCSTDVCHCVQGSSWCNDPDDCPDE